MNLHVGEVVSEVEVEDGEEGGGRRAVSQWEQLALYRRLNERSDLDAARTAAFGNDD